MTRTMKSAALGIGITAMVVIPGLIMLMLLSTAADSMTRTSQANNNVYRRDFYCGIIKKD